MSTIRDLDKVKKEETEKLLDWQKKLVSVLKWTAMNDQPTISGSLNKR